ncbi:twin-arginine translocation signal domain-containing protein [Rufibacter hautae]|uniref:Twin-arginine translocation signal domain-containing protein n=1 Tax=Rufibacter hautae TaxID=2595005 RepID=A0A5B6TCP0_9BACT|nr:twin-arginine translocation signal domain-containing protein [Rufibacter hautae]KAA3436784.1 twin-arginine translocation signal domain-containing protein [Rufibacter hautae]
MNRRNFLRLTGLAGAALVALPSLGFMSTSIKDAAVGIITKELSYLKLDKKGVEQFVDDYFKGHYINSSLKTQINLKSCYYLGVDANESRLLSKLVHNYLTSTDFFLNKMDESKTVKYIGVNKSYKMPCSNPFSSFYYPPATV